MYHPAAHRDCVLQCFIRDTDLFERMNAPRRNRQIDRPPANYIAFARIGSSLVKIDIVATAPQVGGEQSAGQTAADENEFRHDSESTNQEVRKTGKETEPRIMGISRMSQGLNQLAQSPPRTQSIVA